MSFTSRDDRTLRGRLTQKIETAMGEGSALLADGIATDWADYRYRTAVYQTLGQVSRWIDEIVADLNAAPRRD